uniref:Uncharacterized protein n=1 Tax=Phaeodactylum tricornutum TaxID=2850 RepID=A0A8J9X1H0_PHATR
MTNTRHIVSLLIMCVTAHAAVRTAEVPLADLLPEHESVFSEKAMMGRAHKLATLASSHHSRAVQETDGAYTGNSIQRVCRAIENQFQDPVRCDCIGALQSNTFSMTCEYDKAVCGPLNAVCGRPVIAMTLVNGGVFSSTTCIRDYVNSRQRIDYKDTCVALELCNENDSSQGFCGCTVSYGADVCNDCNICNNGMGVQIDCSNVDENAITTQCRTVDLDMDLAGGAGLIAGFLPGFEDFCSSLEEGTGSNVGCECADSGSGNYEVNCKTLEEKCSESNVCGQVATSVDVDRGRIKSVRTCADIRIPYTYEQTCSTVSVEETADGRRIDGCGVFYNDQACNNCQICNDGKGIIFDCSNIDANVAVDNCQPVLVETMFEFVPEYTKPPATLRNTEDGAGIAQNQPVTASSASSFRYFWGLGCILATWASLY